MGRQGREGGKGRATIRSGRRSGFAAPDPGSRNVPEGSERAFSPQEAIEFITRLPSRFGSTLGQIPASLHGTCQQHRVDLHGSLVDCHRLEVSGFQQGAHVVRGPLMVA